MLADFLKDAALAFDASHHPMAKNIGDLLRDVEVVKEPEILQNLSVSASLQTVLGATNCHPAAEKLSYLAGNLSWICAALSRPKPGNFVGSYNFVAVVGPDSIIHSDQFRFGLYLQEPETFYPSHKHEAEELYLPLSGRALWQKGDAEFEPVENGQAIHHLSYQPHATWTHDLPMMAFWA